MHSAFDDPESLETSEPGITLVVDNREQSPQNASKCGNIFLLSTTQLISSKGLGLAADTETHGDVLSACHYQSYRRSISGHDFEASASSCASPRAEKKHGELERLRLAI